MRFRCLFLLLFAAALASAQSKTDLNILGTEQRRFEAMLRRDTAALRGLLADDLVYMHSNALKESKKEHLAAIAGGRLVYEKMTREEAQVRRYGKTALTNGTVQVKVVLEGKSLEMRLAYTAVYRKKRGTWQLLNWQSTRVQ